MYALPFWSACRLHQWSARPDRASPQSRHCTREDKRSFRPRKMRPRAAIQAHGSAQRQLLLWDRSTPDDDLSLPVAPVTERQRSEHEETLTRLVTIRSLPISCGSFAPSVQIMPANAGRIRVLNAQRLIVISLAQRYVD